jgi:hypothetical protein
MKYNTTRKQNIMDHDIQDEDRKHDRMEYEPEYDSPKHNRKYRVCSK